MQFDKKMLDSPLPCSYADLDGRLVLCNDIIAGLLDLKTRQDIYNKRVHDLVQDKKFAERVEQTLLNIIKDKAPQTKLYTFKTKKENTITWLNGMNPVFDNNGQIHGVYGFGIPLVKNSKCFMNRDFSEEGFTTHALGPVTIDEDFQHPYLEMITKKEQEVLTHLLSGYTSKGISQKLHRSYRTIETHISHIKSKLSVNSRDQLIDLCYESNLTQILRFI